MTGWRATPAGRQVWRLLVAVAGGAVVVVGLVLVPAPGPGWLVVAAGVAIWAREFAWAHRLMERVLALVRAGTEHAGPRGRRQAVLGTGAGVMVAVGCLAALWLAGVPTWLPDAVEHPLAGAVDRFRP